MSHRLGDVRSDFRLLHPKIVRLRGVLVREFTTYTGLQVKLRRKLALAPAIEQAYRLIPKFLLAIAPGFWKIPCESAPLLSTALSVARLCA